ncbi:MAG: Rpn family recombination-promoting nuclease/putative transposase [Gammaproteobacteria bacterium]
MLNLQNTNNPHDAFCKKLFEHPDLALAFILDHIPKLRGQTIGFPKDMRGEFVDSETFSNLQSDWVWKLKLKPKPGRPKYIYIILEHKSSPDLKVRIQLSKYNTGLLEYLANKNRNTPQHPPEIIQIVLYHGKRQWNLIEDYKSNLNLGKRVRSTTAPLTYINLSTLPRDKLSSNPSLHAAFYTMLYTTGVLGKRNKAQSMEKIIKITPEGSSIADLLLVYLTAIDKSLIGIIKAAIKKMKSTEEGDRIMTNLVDQWLAEGRAEGRAEGIAGLLTQQLQRKFGPLSEDIRQQLTQATPDDLEAWGNKILDAPSLEAIFGDQPRH